MNGVLIAVVIVAVVVVIGGIVAAVKGKTSHNAAVLPGKEEVPASEPKSEPDSSTSEFFCKKCGAKLRKNDVFCVECGQKVE